MKLPNLEIQHDGNLPIKLTTEQRTALKGYVWVSINCQGVEAYMKAYICSVTVYDLLLGLRWMATEGTDEDSHGQEDVEHNRDGRKRANGPNV